MRQVILMLLAVSLLVTQRRLFASDPMKVYLTRQEAVALAVRFVKEIGATESDPVIAEPPTQQKTGVSVTDYRPVWRIFFADKTFVDILDQTGGIAFYVSGSFPQPRHNLIKPPDLSREEIIAQAELVLRAMQAPPNLPLQFAYQDTGSSTIQWVVTWQRTFHGVPFFFCDGSSLQLDGVSGRALIANLGYSIPDPPTPHAKIGSESANTIARTLIKDKRNLIIEKQNETVPQLVIVKPNTFWGKLPPNQAIPALAWLCGFHFSNQTGYGVWVDAESGAIIGGFPVNME